MATPRPAVHLNEKSMLRCDRHRRVDGYGPVVGPGDHTNYRTSDRTSDRTGNRIGVIGAGQLGQMMLTAAIPLDLELHFLSEDASDPAAVLSPHHHLGSALSASAVRDLAAHTDVITCEHELVDLEILSEIGGGSDEGSGSVFPTAATLSQVVDKVAMRAAVDAAGVPAPPWKVATNLGDLEAAVNEWPDLVVKAARGGYDGRGLAFIRGGRIETDQAAWMENLSAGTGSVTGGGLAVLEPLLDLSAELAVLVVRGVNGQIVVYDPVRTVQVEGQCRAVLTPHGLGAAVDITAREIAVRVAEHIEVVGVLAVEMFVSEGHVLVNELAARPHNSGHHSIDACVTSQFENHLRAVAGLCLGSTAPTGRAAVMVNLIALTAETDPRDQRDAGLAVDPRVRLHLYGKAPQPQRKVGHVTVVADDGEEALHLAWRAVRALGCDDREREVHNQMDEGRSGR